ncbi:MAG: 50S ribosomal protein L6 [Clostridia bacterium]|nr:50S ribosomal protein L6 [Clostridia bacterium]
MSRIGRLPIALPANVTVDVTVDNYVVVAGPKGSLRQYMDSCITLTKEENEGKTTVVLTRSSEEPTVKAKHGLYRALIAGMVKGVTDGYSKSLTVNGVGYKVEVKGNKLVMNIGFSHPVNVDIPEGLAVTCPSITEIVVSGISKERVGQFAADIKAIKPVEPYHGYGIHYTNETVRMKEIKKGAKKK